MITPIEFIKVNYYRYLTVSGQKGINLADAQSEQ